MAHPAHQFPVERLTTHNEYRIIIAEDDEQLATMLTRLILRHSPSATIQIFGNGLDALAAYDHSGADLLFANHGMPGIDGPTLIRTVRARGDSVPMIGMSGNPGRCDENMAAGATTFVAGAELLTQLSAILRRFAPVPRSLVDAFLCPSSCHGDSAMHGVG